MKYAFFQAALTAEGRAVVSEIIEAPRTQDGHTFQLHELYHASLVLTARPIPDGVEVGATFDLATGEYTNPEPVAMATTSEEEEPGGTGNGEPPPPPPKGK